MSGYYRMARGWQDHPVLNREPMCRRAAWAWLIEEAAWEPTSIRVAGKVIDLARGELSCAQRVMADAWGWTLGKCQRFLAELVREEMISIGHAAGRESSRIIVTICNYERYQARAPRTESTASQLPSQRRVNFRVNNRVISDDTNTLQLNDFCGPAEDERVNPQITDDAETESTRESQERKEIRKKKDTSEPYGSEGAAIATPPLAPLGSVDFVRELFARGKEQLGQKSGALLGKMRAEYGDPAVIDAIVACEDEAPSNPPAFFVRCLQTRRAGAAGRGRRSPHMEMLEAFDAVTRS